jgi:RNA polymerase sigma-70 factor (ECF subfamily)
VPLHSDCRLVELIQTGDRDAFRAFYDQFHRLVYRYINVRVGDLADTEDLVSETFIRAWQALPRFKCGEKPVGAWLLRIAHNLVVDKYRQKRAWVQWLPWHQADSAATPAGRPYDQVDHQDEIRRAFGALSYEQQVILHMHFFEDCPIEEVAEFLGKSPNAVRVAQFRALRRLRQVLQAAPDRSQPAR